MATPNKGAKLGPKATKVIARAGRVPTKPSRTGPAPTKRGGGAKPWLTGTMKRGATVKPSKTGGLKGKVR